MTRQGYKRAKDLEPGDRVMVKGDKGHYFPTSVICVETRNETYITVWLTSFGYVSFKSDSWVQMVDESLDTLSALAPQSRLQPETFNGKGID